VAPARSDDLLYEVESLARRGETIAAIRRYRELTGAGLREARSAVNAITPTTSRPGVTLAKLGKEDRLRANLISVAVGTVALLGSGVAGAPVGVAVFIGFAIFSLSRFVTGNVFRGFRSED
jgi:hypothetical protein